MLEKYLDFAKQIALEAGEITLKYFKGDNGANYKCDKTIVTKADKEINSHLISRVKEAFPTHSVDGEEEQFGTSSLVWVCDPIDGTAMYAHHIPVSVFSLALVEDGTPIVGVIYDAFTENMYYAAKGSGAFLNGAPIHVSDSGFDGMKTMANLDMWPGADYNLYGAFGEIGMKTYSIDLGSIIRACACIASGDMILGIYPGTKHKNCDIAAAKVIVEEAGGRVTDLFGNEQRYDGDINGAVISNGKVHDEVLAILAKYI